MKKDICWISDCNKSQKEGEFYCEEHSKLEDPHPYTSVPSAHGGANVPNKLKITKKLNENQ